ncbi:MULTISPECIES: RagB/SusD family nutrient uptake outer membrane protein [Parabacteroides]|uniref:RagB/SusD family nutrient uptake outer membrane protein n=2 Tax=Parabacteroides goldsteinii TaxID=328812 RepID=A0A6G1ZAF1_9BACT|nr:MULTISPECIES: RagB/SusD family nutrient uptake outer membrane protein [Parabacteroides]EOS12637.1 hypothetical protein C803_05566 [Parabacteroides goldsteinii dnLKV18]KAI4363129.1 SusD-like protein P38 [Parabacteroides sp. ASF519]MBF0764581.1 RagB/SusD family nutrient uptake outer membrane protein [Parabacteroides goldsteinii]MDZ3926307.1 RagB/SusD family nutrient uptake outer membrane protein [Parabacteroides goldsteinii]MRX92408.1 RagB/SusD family nutrient uptake outer membrane protein [P
MKKIYAVFLSTLLFTSCLNDFLDVDPVSDIATSTFWQTDNDVRAALNSVYADFQTNYNKNSAGNYMTWFEMRSDNFVGTTVSSSMPTYAANTNKLNSSHVSADWNVWYKSISTVNYALHYIPDVQGLTAIKKDNYLAEAYFLRAFCYFNLARIWGNVPLVEKPTLSLADVEKPTQSPQSQVLDLVGKDLEEAVKLVDEGQNDVFRFNPGALYALYTDYAMWMRDYDKAILYSGKLMDLKRYSLLKGTEFAQVCADGTTSENIWTMKWSYQNNKQNWIIYMMCRTAAPQMIPSEGVKNLWNTEEYRVDLRRYQTIDTTIVYASNHISSPNGDASIWKWQPGERVIEANEKYVPFYRYADILLLRAEALNKQQRQEEALELLNMIRERAGLSLKTMDDFTNASDRTLAMEDAILQERQLELLGEGRRWFDLIRTGRAMKVMNDYFENYIEAQTGDVCPRFTDEWQLYWPVYYNNILENANLIQNGNY